MVAIEESMLSSLVWQSIWEKDIFELQICEESNGKVLNYLFGISGRSCKPRSWKDTALRKYFLVASFPLKLFTVGVCPVRWSHDSLRWVVSNRRWGVSKERRNRLWFFIIMIPSVGFHVASQSQSPLQGFDLQPKTTKYGGHRPRSVH